MSTYDPEEREQMERAALDHLAAQNCSHHARDLAVAAMMIRGARSRRAAFDALKRARRFRLEWLTITQRDWQRKARAVHARRNLRTRTAAQSFGTYAANGTAAAVAERCIREAISTRELYVRCSA